MQPLFELDGVSFVSLQKGAGEEQLDDTPGAEGIVQLGEKYDAGPHAFRDTVAVLNRLDLVVTVDTAIAHLAGALGRPAWVLLPFIPAWRWLMDREDSPWYPSLRLFPQQSPGGWESVIERVSTALQELAERHTG